MFIQWIVILSGTVLAGKCFLFSLHLRHTKIQLSKKPYVLCFKFQFTHFSVAACKGFMKFFCVYNKEVDKLKFRLIFFWEKVQDWVKSRKGLCLLHFVIFIFKCPSKIKKFLFLPNFYFHFVLLSWEEPPCWQIQRI